MSSSEAASLYFRSLEPGQGWDGGREAVSASQRGRMFHAMMRAVASKSYSNVTVADVVSGAGVSRRTFYEHFEDKEECFLAAYETGTEVLIGDILETLRGLPADARWRGRLRAALQSYTEALAAEPEFARTFLIDVLGAGPKAVQARQRVYDMFV